MGGSSGQQSQTSTVSLSPQQQQYINMGLPFAQQFAANQPTLPSASSAIAPFNPNQIAGQNMALNAAGGAQQGIANNAANASNFLTSGQALAGPNANPFLESAIRGATLPARQTLQMQTLPGLRQQATGVGGMGNSREALSEGVATGLEAQGEQATGAQMENQAYQTGLGAMERGLALAPSTQAATLAPATTTSGVGDVQQQLEQALRSYTTQAGLFQQEQPLTTAEALSGIGAGIPGGSVTTTASGNQQLSPLQMGVGGAAMLGSLFGAPSGGTSAMSGLGSALSGAGSMGMDALSQLFGSGASGIASFLPFLAIP